MPAKIPIGVSDFRRLREERCVFVDKSLFVRDVVERGSQILVFPRPRRFGKTLSLSMLRCFFERGAGDPKRLFEGLALAAEGDDIWRHAGRYPVVLITLKGARADTWESTYELIQRTLGQLFEEHRAAINGAGQEAAYWERLRRGTGNLVDWALSLQALIRALHRHHGEKVVVLIDEYDAPIHAAYVGGYLRPAIEFFRIFLGEALKDNPHLERGVVTGILRVARENIFSGLNHLDVYTLLERPFAGAFGFSEEEVTSLLEENGLLDQLAIVRGWYNGYLFGGRVAYNPWSVLNFVARQGKAAPYWLNTSSNDLVRDLLQRHAVRIQDDMELLLKGGSIVRRPDENIVFSRLETDPGAALDLLLFSGYLKAAPLPASGMDAPAYALSIPNLEVREVYESTFSDWMRQALRREGGSLDTLLSALLSGDAAMLEQQISAFASALLSFHDLAGKTPERVYQGFMLGLTAALLPDFEVRSNREVGRGRADMWIRPKHPGRAGVVIELKVAKSKSGLTRALEQGMSQIREKGYANEMSALGVAPIWCVAIAFDGKAVRVRTAEAGKWPRTRGRRAPG